MLIEELPGWFREEGVLEQHMREHGWFITIPAVRNEEEMIITGLKRYQVENAYKAISEGHDETCNCVACIFVRAKKKERPMEDMPKEMIGREVGPVKPDPMRRTLQMQQEKDDNPLPPLMRMAREPKRRPIPARFEDCATVEEINLLRHKLKLQPLIDKGWRNAFGERESECQDRVFLHTFNIPVWDSEYAVDGIRDITFFQRPISMNFQHMRDKTKCEPDTNLNQSSMLDYPIEHTVHGFNVSIEEGISESDRLSIINNGYLMFIFAGRRPYFYIPLAKVVEDKRKPIGELFTEFMKVVRPSDDVVPEIGWREAEEWKKKFEDTVATKMYDFTVDEDRHIHITPGYAFNGRIMWPDGLHISRPIKIRYYIEGKLWIPAG